MKILLVSTSGGHFSTIRGLKDFWLAHERVWVTDQKKDTEVLLEDKETVHWLPYQGPRDLFPFLSNLAPVFKIVFQDKPDIIVSTGASIAVSFALVAKVFGIPFVYIESISRAQELSFSGKLIYPICHEFYVQWPTLCSKYPKAIYKGTV